MQDIYLRIIFEVLGVTGFLASAYYNYHPDIHLNRFDKFQQIFTLNSETRESTRRGMRMGGHVSIAMAILIGAFLLRDINMLINHWF